MPVVSEHMAAQSERLRDWANGIYDMTPICDELLRAADAVDAQAAEIARMRDALIGIKRAGRARMHSYGDEHSYYYYTAKAALEGK
jgi:hypothetical protein